MGRKLINQAEFDRDAMWFLKEALRLLQQAVKLLEKERRK